MSFRTQERVDVEPLSVADSLHECAAASPRAWQAAVDDAEDEVVEVFFSKLCERSSRNNFLETLIAERIDSFLLLLPSRRIWTLTILAVESC
jgi:hypothetical protein